MLVRDAVRRGAVTTEAAATLWAAADAMDRAGVGSVLVVDGGRLVGIVTDRDIVVRAVARRLAPDARVDSVMSTALTTIDADAPLEEAIGVFAAQPVRRLPVLDGGEPIGVLTADDLLVDLVNDLGRVVRPVTAQVLFSGPEPHVPATPGG